MWWQIPLSRNPAFLCAITRGRGRPALFDAPVAAPFVPHHGPSLSARPDKAPLPAPIDAPEEAQGIVAG